MNLAKRKKPRPGRLLLGQGLKSSRFLLCSCGIGNAAQKKQSVLLDKRQNRLLENQKMQVFQCVYDFTRLDAPPRPLMRAGFGNGGSLRLAYSAALPFGLPPKALYAKKPPPRSYPYTALFPGKSRSQALHLAYFHLFISYRLIIAAKQGNCQERASKFASRYLRPFPEPACPKFQCLGGAARQWGWRS